MNGPDRSDSANVGSWLEVRAGLDPERPALIDDASGEVVSYRGLNELANRAAQALLDARVGPGDRVGLALRSEPLYLAVYFAAAKLGAILIPLNTRLTAHELEAQLRDAEASIAIHADDVALGATPGLRAWTRAEFALALPARAGEPRLLPTCAPARRVARCRAPMPALSRTRARRLPKQ